VIIGVSGRMSSGKDTVGKVIQYLTDGAEEKFTFEEYLERYYSLGNYGVGWLPEWEIHKFADALKEIVCILTRCSRQELEDQDFKNSYLSDEWSNFKHCFNLKGEYEGENVFRYTYRDALQKVGTDLFRNQFHEDVWVNALMSKYNNGRRVILRNATTNIDTTDKWIVTDVRFPNESKAIKDRGGLLIKVTRPSVVSNSTHPSETMVDSLESDYVIDNNGSLQDLVEKTREILLKEKIIK